MVSPLAQEAIKVLSSPPPLKRESTFSSDGDFERIPVIKLDDITLVDQTLLQDKDNQNLPAIEETAEKAVERILETVCDHLLKDSLSHETVEGALASQGVSAAVKTKEDKAPLDLIPDKLSQK